MEEEQFSGWYKKRFSDLNENPPEEVWNNISSQLDLEDVWMGVDSKLTAIGKRKKIKRRISFVTLLIFLLAGVGTFLFYQTKKSDQKISTYTSNPNPVATKSKSGFEKNKPVSKLSKILNTAEKNNSFSRKKIGHNSPDYYKGVDKQDYTPKNTLAATSTVNESVISFNVSKSIAKTHSINNNDSLLCIYPLHISLPSLHHSDTLFQPLITAVGINADFFEKNNPVDNFHRFYVGGAYTFKNTWLLNNTTLKGLGSQTLDQTNLHFGHAYGVSAGYYFTPIWNTELNWYFNSQQGQTYHVYYEGNYAEKRIKLDFMMFNISIKRNNTPKHLKNNLQTGSGFITGTNFAFLKMGNDELTSSYSKSDFGLRFGYEYNILLFHNFLLSSGIITDIGLTNIYRGNSFTPGSFNKTHNASIGFNVGVKRLFSEKK